MATLTRSTPSFAPPATQNTAPVHEFRCLYTHDLRKKAKKWHDGSARFHTFNKRVMVYDEAKNFIGDLHYRADDEFGEGTELQLDRGVMVEVGERMGTTQTDLTGIVHRANPDITNTPGPPATIQPRTVQRVPWLHSQSRPKSLTELLGTTQGRPGRAVLPITSPFEQRQTLEQPQHVERREASSVERQAKRQKLTTGKENEQVIQQRPKYIRLSDTPLPRNAAASPVISRFQAQRQTTARPVVAAAQMSSKVIDISSDEDVESPPISSVTNPETTPRPSVVHVVEQNSTSKVSKKKDNPKKQIARKEHEPPARRSKPVEIASSKPVPAPAGSATSSRSSTTLGMCSLKMKSQGPRKKLMYRALLPSRAPSQIEQTSPAVIRERENTTRHERNPLPIVEMVLDDDNADQNTLQDQPDQLSDSVCVETLPSTPPRAPPSPRQSSATAKSPLPSPLFVSQSVSQRSPTPIRTSITDHADILATQVLARRSSPVINANDRDSPGISDNGGDYAVLEPESPCFPPPPPRPKPLEQPQPAPIWPSALSPPTPFLPQTVQRIPSPDKTRPFSRSLSENDSPFPNDPRTSPAHGNLNPIAETLSTKSQHITFSHPPANPLHRSVPAPIAKTATTSIQRSRSDTTAIVPNTITDPGPAPTTSPEEEGPWTKLEAFLLFDKWPTCKEKGKPHFEPIAPSDRESDGQDEEIDDEFGFRAAPVQAWVPMATRGQRKPPPVLIRSARAVWKDGQTSGV